jgi:Dihydropteroate synthase and related enzymes
VHEVTGYVTEYAERAVAGGVPPDAVLVDPAHDFGKNTWQSLEVTRRLGELTGTGWPVLVAVADKDFIGETLGLPVASGPRGRSRPWPCAPGWARGCSACTTCRPPVRRSPRWRTSA